MAFVWPLGVLLCGYDGSAFLTVDIDKSKTSSLATMKILRPGFGIRNYSGSGVETEAGSGCQMYHFT